MYSTALVLAKAIDYFGTSWLLLDTYPATQITRIYIVVDNCCIHEAKLLSSGWQATHGLCCCGCQRTVRVLNSIAGVFGNVYDSARNHKGKCLRDVVQDVERHVQVNVL